MGYWRWLREALVKASNHALNLSHFVYFGAAAMGQHEVYMVCAGVIFCAMVVLVVLAAPEV